MSLSRQHVDDFQSVVWEYYRQAGRHELPWRQPESDPYQILVSEIMLQQTQVSRVIPKYQQFLELFPTIEALANSSLAAVLTAWSGLGYNRRAKFLHQAAKTVVHDYHGVFPSKLEDLVKLPGVGKNTAGAILAYTFNKPVVFVETNIRTVYFHHFFAGRPGQTAVGPGREVVADGEVVRLVGETLDTTNPREWYWALMDYGAHLKASGMKLNALSKQYTKQTKFEGSQRQIRGQIIRKLTIEDLDLQQLSVSIPDIRLAAVLKDLVSEGLIVKKASRYHLSD